MRETALMLLILSLSIPAVRGEVEKAGVTPDSPLYLLDRAAEKLLLLLSPSYATVAELQLQHASERLAEMEEMTAKRRYQYLAPLAESYMQSLSEAKALAASSMMKPKEKERLSKALARVEDEHLRRLNALADIAPPEARQAFERAEEACKAKRAPMRAEARYGARVRTGVERALDALSERAAIALEKRIKG